MPDAIPQTAPGRAYLAHKDEYDEAIERVLGSGTYILGEEVEAFEAEFATAQGSGTAVGVASGTDAIELALRSLGIGPGDAVFTVSHTAVATVAAIERAGALPVLVDIEPEHFTMDPARLEEAIGNPPDLHGARPTAVVPVHLYGHMADMPTILRLARAADLLVVEDCAQAHGARLDGRVAGTWGDAAAFSFYPTKNLPAFGDGGLVMTADPATATRIRTLRQYGWSDTRSSTIPGMNSRLDALQAAILRVGLRHLDADNRSRREIAARYDVLDGPGIRTPRTAPGVDHVFHQYVVQSPRRVDLRADLQRAGITTAIHYPMAVHQQPAYRDRLPVAGNLAVTEQVVDEILSLPMFPSLGLDTTDRVIGALRTWAGATSG